METLITRWWWIRHAPVLNAENIIYGQMDLNVDVSSTKIFFQLAEMLPSNPVLITSDLKRTTLTADAIARAGGKFPKPIKEPALREQNFGSWQGEPRDQFNISRGQEMHRFWIAPAFERPPNGESFADLIARVAPTINRITTSCAGRDIICVSHGGTIRAAIAVALDLGPERALSINIANCSLTRLDHAFDKEKKTAVWSLVMVNFDPSMCKSLIDNA